MFKKASLLVGLVILITALLVGGAAYVMGIRESYRKNTYGITIAWSKTSPFIMLDLPHRKFLMINTGNSQDVPATVSQQRYFFEKKIDQIVVTGTQSYALKGLYWLEKKFAVGDVHHLDSYSSDINHGNCEGVEIDGGRVCVLQLLDSKGRCVDECLAVFVCRGEKCFLYNNVLRKSSQRYLAEFIKDIGLEISAAYLGKISTGESLTSELIGALGDSKVYISPSGNKAESLWNSLALQNQAKEKPLTLNRVPVGEEVLLEI